MGEFQQADPLFVNAIELLLPIGGISDATRGGLIMGRSHAEGHIVLVVRNEQGMMISNMEGYEYYVNREAFEAHKDEIVRMNEEGIPGVRAGTFKRCPVPDHITQVHAKTVFGVPLIYLAHGGGFIVNTCATVKNWDRLEAINSAYQF